MHKLSGSLVLGYHGCDRGVAERLLSNPDESFIFSTNDYDWLGEGVYFWEANPLRGLEFAREQQKRGKVEDPYVVGAAIDLGYCLDLISSTGTQAVAAVYDDFKAYCERAGVPLPVNERGPDRLLKRLDCAVINHLHGIRQKALLPSFDTVRGAFHEGGALYSGSGFSKKAHIQICVRNLECIMAVFRVKRSQLEPL